MIIEKLASCFEFKDYNNRNNSSKNYSLIKNFFSSKNDYNNEDFKNIYSFISKGIKFVFFTNHKK